MRLKLFPNFTHHHLLITHTNSPGDQRCIPFHEQCRRQIGKAIASLASVGLPLFLNYSNHHLLPFFSLDILVDRHKEQTLRRQKAAL